MKPVSLADSHTIGSLGTQTTSYVMGIDETSLEHVQMLLIDVYSDKPLACIREYSTNARDEHVKHGIKRPIEVTLPNQMSPFLKIRDFAAGMSEDTIATVYSKYGASTKRDSNDFNGMLGIGGKAGLTYTTQFTVVSIHDGIKMTVIVSRVGSKAQMEVISRVPTTEPSGVEVTMPVKTQDVREFVSKAEFLFSFWDEGQVLVNGKAPQRVKVKMVTDQIGTSQDLDEDYVVMAGVPYPVGNRLYNGRSSWNAFKAVAFVGIGDVAITPSREALAHNTPTTDTTLEVLRMELTEAIRKTVTDEVNAAPTKHAGYAKMKEWHENLGSAMPRGITYNGVVFPDSFDFSFARWDRGRSRYAYQGGHRRIGFDALMSGLLVTGFDADSVTPRNKEKINMYMADKGIGGTVYFIVEAAPTAEVTSWIDPVRVISWAAVKAISLPKKAPAQGVVRKQPTIDIFDALGVRRPATPDPTKIQLYISPADKIASGYVTALYKAFPNVEVVEIGANRWEKFIRENPNAVKATTFLRREQEKAVKALTDNDLMIKGMDHWSAEKYKHLDEKVVLDPKLINLIQIAKGTAKTAALTHFEAVEHVCQGFGLGRSALRNVPITTRVDYPLLNSARAGSMESKHMHIYVNAVWTANQKGN